MFKQVQTGQAYQFYPGVQHRIGWAGDDVHRMSRLYQRFAQIADVYTLTTACGAAAIAEQANLQGFYCALFFQWQHLGEGARVRLVSGRLSLHNPESLQGSGFLR